MLPHYLQYFDTLELNNTFYRLPTLPALKAWRAVLPGGTLLFAVGGIKPDNMAPYWAAGADGFGTGSNLYAPGASAERRPG